MPEVSFLETFSAELGAKVVVVVDGKENFTLENFYLVTIQT